MLKYSRSCRTVIRHEPAIRTQREQRVQRDQRHAQAVDCDAIVAAERNQADADVRTGRCQPWLRVDADHRVARQV